MANPWFRMYAEFLHDPKVRVMSDIDQLRLVLLFCLRCNGSVTLQDKHVTFALRISDVEWQQTKCVFMESGFIDSANNVLNWDKRQYVSDSSAARVAKHRALHKPVTETKRNVTVTPPEQNRTDTEQNRTDINASSSPAEKPPKTDAIPYEKIVNLYHEKLPELPKVAMLTTKRKGQIGARWKSGNLPDIETWAEYFDFVKQSDFLMGMTDPVNGHKRFKADLEWLTSESNYTKVCERKYHGKR